MSLGYPSIPRDILFQKILETKLSIALQTSIVT